jgi:hypothetical protein
MLASAPRNDEPRTLSVREDLCGDFACGQRGEFPSHPTKPCDFATGLRHRDSAPTTGDFATGMQSTQPSARATGNFATGQRRGETAALVPMAAERRGWRLLIPVLRRD